MFVFNIFKAIFKCSCLPLSLYLNSNYTLENGSKIKNDRIKLEDIIIDQNNYSLDNVSWYSNYQLLYRKLEGSIALYDFLNDSHKILASNSNLARFKIEKFSLSPNNRYILICFDLRRHYTYSYRASYAIYDTANNEINIIKLPETKKYNEDDDQQWTYIEWGPQGTQMVSFLCLN